VCSSEVGGYAGGMVATARVTHTRQVTAEEPDKVSPTSEVKGGLLKRLTSSLGKHKPKLWLGPPGLGVGYEADKYTL
jgi:hypothetical protein